MASLTIRRVTICRYRQPVAFGEHRMMLRPRGSHRRRVLEARLRISPEPRSLRFVQDAFGNQVGIARFSGRAKNLCFESVVRLDHSASRRGSRRVISPCRPMIPLRPPGVSAHGATHAWAQAYLPGAGWIDFDPTHGRAGASSLVTVAVVPDPRQAIPLHRAFTGFPSDPLGMEVEVSVTADASATVSAVPRRAAGRP